MKYIKIGLLACNVLVFIIEKHYSNAKEYADWETLTSQRGQFDLYSIIFPIILRYTGNNLFHTFIEGHLGFLFLVFITRKSLVMHAYMIPVFAKLKQEDQEHKASLWDT